MAETRLECPHCGRVGSTTRELRAGASARCPGCHESFKIGSVAPTLIKSEVLNPPTTLVPPLMAQVPLARPDCPPVSQPSRQFRLAIVMGVGSGVLVASVAIGLAWLLLFRSDQSAVRSTEVPAASKAHQVPAPVAVKASPDDPISSITEEDVDDLIADDIAAHPPVKSDGIPGKDDPAYGAIIRYTLMTRANERIVPGRGLKAWRNLMTREQRLAVELQRLGRNTEDIFRRGWDDEVPALLLTLRNEIGTPAAMVAANDLERFARLVRPADANGERRGDVIQSSKSSEAMLDRYREREAKIKDVFHKDVDAYFHRIWLQSGRSQLWADWR